MKNIIRQMDYPVYLALAGAILSAIGAYWSSRNQDAESKENAKLYKRLAEKSDTITDYAKKQAIASEENAQLYKQLAEYAKKQEKNSKEVTVLQQKLLEKADIQTQKTEQIAQLNADLAQSQKEIARLSQDITNNVTGGSSFCYVILGSTRGGNIKVDVSHQGRYPLSNVRMLITNESASYRIAGNSGPMLRAMSMFRRSSATVFAVGNLPPSPTSTTVGEIDNVENGWDIYDSYFIEFFANNGSWTQRYQIGNADKKGHNVVTKDGKTVFER